jgi:CheY-like chemotaxis protein
MALEETLDEKARDSLERSLSASRSLVTVVNDLLDLTNAESDAYVVHEEDLELKPQVLQLIGAFREEATRKGIELAFEDDLSIPHRLRGDPPRLRQVMSNLLDNAIQYSNKGLVTTGIHLLAQTDTTSMVEIYVHDSGPGLSEAELDNIFQDFEQILDDEEYEISPKGRDEGEDHESPTAKQVSVGLGLAIVARFVRLNHGQVSISSEEGKGLRVAVTLPFRKTLPDSPRDRRRSIKLPLPTPPTEFQTLLTESHGFITPPTLGLFTTAQTAEGMNVDTISSQEQNKSPASDSGFQMSPTSGEPSIGTMNATRYPFPSMFSCLKILIAEDNPLNSRLLETRLKRKGHSVTLASDGQACADIFKSQPHLFDIILMDIQACYFPPSLLHFLCKHLTYKAPR